MSTFTLKLYDATNFEVIEGIASFVGEDSSGSFGIRAGHARMMTNLSFGLARFRAEPGDWRYIAVPGALLYFADDILSLSTRHYVIDDDYMRISAAVTQQLATEEMELRSMKASLHRLEEEALRRMWRLGQPGP